MTIFEILTLVFVDSFTTNLFFIVNDEFAIWAALKLSDVEKTYILVANGAALMLASLCNYIMGLSIYKIMQNYAGNNEIMQEKSHILKSIMDRFYYYLVGLSFLAVYSKFLVLFAGYARSRAIIYIVGTSIVKTIYYAISN